MGAINRKYANMRVLDLGIFAKYSQNAFSALIRGLPQSVQRILLISLLYLVCRGASILGIDNRIL
jgi:hypothetical protein